MSGAFQRLADLFEEARTKSASERESFIAEACGDNTELLAELRRLLARHQQTSGVLDEPLDPQAMLASDPLPEALPAAIGPYAIKERIGVGGMGIVYLAEQENPRREVAVKVIRPGFVTREMLKRFDLEAAMLGRLQHPGIAQIHEAGVYDDGSGGRPYFAMEYVKGFPLLDYAEASGLDLSGRLEVVAKVCDAVQHAHQRGVVHRDLKPGNILVDDAGRPRVLDFGIARAADADIQMTTTLQTRTGQLMGTIAYMSPEQVNGRIGDIDSRSDVYALGVILFELIAGRLPFDLREKTMAGVMRTILDEEPTSLTTIDRSYRGDLATIVAKALEKDPDRRYLAASDLGADLRRYLDNEPILARPATTMYQLRKFARRNRGLVAGITTALLALVAGVIVAVIFAIGQTQALVESERQRSIADAVNAFLTSDLIQQVDPDIEADRDLTLVAALDRAAAKIEGRFDGAPLVEANLRLTIGTAYRNLDRLDDAATNIDRALLLFAQELDANDEALLLCRMERIALLQKRGEYDLAVDLTRELLPVQRETLGPDHEQTMASHHQLGSLLLQLGRFDEAEPVLEAVLEHRERVLGVDAATATSLNNLAILYTYTGRFEEAAPMMQRSLDMHRETGGLRHPETLRTMINLGGIYGRLRQHEQGVAVMEEAVALHREVLGERHQGTLQAASSLATMYGFTGEHVKREQLLAETLVIQREVQGEDHLDTLVTRMNLTRSSFDRQEYAAAAAEYGDVASRMIEHHPAHFMGGIARMFEGRSLIALERFTEAETALMNGWDHLVTTVGEDAPQSRGLAMTFVQLYEAWERPEDAELWRGRGSQPST